MKKIYTFLTACAFGLSFTSCDDFLDYQPTAVIDEDTAFSYPEEMVTAAYAMLGDCWYTYPFNLWPYGDLTSDDCLKGGWGTGDTNYHHLEIWSSLSSRNPDHMDELWYRLYCAISRCNRALAKIASELGIPKFTTYSARHSFASMLNWRGVDISYISESLGHSSLSVTERYLAGFSHADRVRNAALLTDFQEFTEGDEGCGLFHNVIK